MTNKPAPFASQSAAASSSSPGAPARDNPNAILRTRLTERFGIRHPILCAPMALVTGGALAAAVSSAGGLGIVGGGYAGTLGGEPNLESEIALAQLENFGVGFIVWALQSAPHMLSAALRHKPSCIFLSFGDPRPFAAEIRKSGVPLVCQVQLLSQMDAAIEAGAAAIVAQGAEAGGHGATRSTFPFVPEAADYLKRRSPETLLLAAGGIADGRGLAAALMLGADGVVVGSRFWAAAEALTPRPHTDKCCAVTGDDTVRTPALDALRGVPWPREYSFRFLKNKLSDEWAGREAEAFRAFGSLAAEYAEARSRHDLDTVAVVCGEAAGLIHNRPPAAEILHSMVAEAARLLRSAPAFTVPEECPFPGSDPRIDHGRPGFT